MCVYIYIYIYILLYIYYILLISWTCACHDSSDISYTSDAYCLQDSFKRNQKICISFENMEDCLFIYDVLHQMQAAVPLLECFLIFNRSTQVPQKLLTSRSLCASLSESMVSMTEVWKPFSWVMSQGLRLTVSLETGCYISEHNRPAWPQGRESKHKAVMAGA